MTVAEALNVSNRSISFREAEIFLQHVLNADRAWLHAHGEVKLTEEQQKNYEACVSRRENNNEPVAYITGSKEFYGRLFKCDSRALIPRPETEGLIDLAKKWCSEFSGSTPCILELGTGCGNIAVTLGLELPNTTIIATDISEEALALAQENWERLGATTESPTFMQADLFDHKVITKNAPFDLIIANLPYVSLEWQFHPDAQPEVIFHEPDIALFGGSDGLDSYRRFFEQAPSYLAPQGIIIVEFGETETEAIVPLATQAFLGKKITIHKDYAELDRVLVVS